MASWRDDNATRLHSEHRAELEMALIVVGGYLIVLGALAWGPDLIEAAMHLVGKVLT
jgi:uncharacterized membrane protein YidH (DUF202 family)